MGVGVSWCIRLARHRVSPSPCFLANETLSVPSSTKDAVAMIFPRVRKTSTVALAKVVALVLRLMSMSTHMSLCQ